MPDTYLKRLALRCGIVHSSEYRVAAGATGGNRGVSGRAAVLEMTMRLGRTAEQASERVAYGPGSLEAGPLA